MKKENIKEILDRVSSGDLAVDSAFDKLRDLPFSELGNLKIDNHRHLRTGLPEVVYAAGKSIEELSSAIERLNSSGFDALLTRLDPETAETLSQSHAQLVYHARSKIGVGYLNADNTPALSGAGTVAVLSAGASDAPVAEEAQLCARILGARVEAISDIGVAGIHRLQSALPALRNADAIIVVAGMEGALPSVVAGLTDKPLIAVPTSVGYGASFGGLAALLAMLNSCASGVSVVNIDNGFGAAAQAVKIALQVSKARAMDPVAEPEEENKA